MTTLWRPAPAPGRRRIRRAAVPFPRRGVLPLPVALVVSGAAGLVYSAAFPTQGVWALAFVGVGGALLALRGRGFWSGALTGFVFGIVFWFSLIQWVTLFLGPVPLLALGTLQALLVGAGGGLVAVAYRAVERLWTDRLGRLGIAPLVVAAAWTCRETVAGTWPYGGFAWGRFAESQSTSPFASLAAWSGITGLSFVLAWLTALAVALLVEPRGLGVRRRDAAPARLLVVVAAVGAILAIPTFPVTLIGSMRIAAVQPNSHAGYFDPEYDPTANLQQAVRTTGGVVGRGAALVVWPEGAAMFDPFADQGVRQQLDLVAQVVGAPLLTGAITQRDGVTYNSSLLWTPGRGITGLYDKVRPVPFGEYVPDRAFWTPFAPDLIELVGRDYTPGTRSSVIEVGRTRVGVNICFDVVDDGLLLGSVADGAEVLVAQTNNADFGDTSENAQQLAIARLRAIETGRALVSDSTVASTTVIGPDGQTIAAAKPFTATSVVADVPLASGITPAVAFGVPLGAAIALLGGVLPLLISLLARPRRRP